MSVEHNFPAPTRREMLKYTHASKRSTRKGLISSLNPAPQEHRAQAPGPGVHPPQMGLLVITACSLGSQAAKGFNTVVGPLDP